jgi:hypothetical protein
VIWIRHETFACFPPCSGVSDSIGGALLTRNLTEVIPNGITIDPGDENEAARVTFDGTQYVVVYQNERLLARTVARNGGVSTATLLGAASLPPATPAPISISRAGNVAVIAFAQSTTNQVWLFRGVGAASWVASFPITQQTSFQYRMPLAAGLPDGRIAYVAPHYFADAPYYGSDRLTLTIGDVAPPQSIPKPPELRMAFDGSDMLVTWEPVSGANGYRLEQRVADGSWTEMEYWFDNDDRKLTVLLGSLLSTTPYALRARAWGDGGVSEYSAPILLGAKRRAVR